MSDYKGDFLAGATVRATFNSYASAGESTTITELVASDIWIYRDGVIQTTLGAGVTIEINVGSAGSHRISIDTNNTTDAGFYAAGHDYEAKLNGALIDTKTVNPFTAEWSIQNRNNEVNLVSILGTALTETPGQLAAAFIKLFDVGTPTLVASDVMRGTDGANTVVPPTEAQMNARTLVAAAYTIVSDLGVVQTADNDTKLSTIISTGSTGPWTTGGGGDATAANQLVILAKLLAYVQLMLREDAAIDFDNLTELNEINADEGSGSGAYLAQNDSQEAIKGAIVGGGGTPLLT